MMSDEKLWYKLILDSQHSVIPAIRLKVIIVIFFSLLITILYGMDFPVYQEEIGGLIPGLVLGLLLVFRTNTAYDRYWEGRKKIGGIIDNSRILARKVLVYIKAKTEEEKQEKLNHLRLISIYLQISTQHLRKEHIDSFSQKFLSQQQYQELNNVNHMPLLMGKWLSDYLKKAYENNNIDGLMLIELNQNLDNLLSNLIACERILSTPIPKAYAIHLKHLLLIYLLTLPFELVGTLGSLTPVGMGIIAFALLGIEAIGLEIENPFGYDSNDLPLNNLSVGIQNGIEELINTDNSLL